MADSNAPLSIEVENLAKLRAALKAAQPGLEKKVTELNFEIADKVAGLARSRATALGGAAAKTAPSIRAAKTSAAANIKLGGPRYPFAKGAEFGSLRYKQFPRYRGNQWEPFGSDGVGYFLHPTIREQRDYIIKTYGDGVTKIVSEAFPS